MISFTTKLYEIYGWLILHLPDEYSKELPSRGMVMINGTLNNISFETPLEPDGRGSHWFKISDHLLQLTNVKAGDTVSLQIEPMKIWSEPEVPTDIMQGLTEALLVEEWNSLTTKARWEWIRWIRSTSNATTRQKRIQVACSKLSSGMRRPCCFNQSICTETAVSKNGILIDPTSH